MNIKLIEIEEEYVRFECQIGNGVGRCDDSKKMTDTLYSAEFDVDIQLNLDNELSVVTKTEPYFHWDGNFNIICGTVESIDEEMQVCVRLSQDFIFLFYLGSGEIAVNDTILIKIRKDDLLISIVGR